MDATTPQNHRRRTKTKAHGTPLRSCTTIQPSYYYGDGFVLRGVKQVCGLLNICSRASSKFSRATRNRLRAVKRLEGVYDPPDIELRAKADIKEKNRNAARAIYSIGLKITKGPGMVFKELFEKYGDAEGVLDPVKLRGFLRDVQGVTLEECLETQGEHFDGSVCFETILVAMLENDAMHGAVDLSRAQDMTRPLTHYWINSSHNTYLSGRQMGMKSANSAQYKKVLESGCRCVEADVWEFGSQLKVCHRSLTNALDLKPVLEQIKESAFKTSPYPVILSIEQHLSGRSLKKMMQCIKDCFRGCLLEDRLKSLKRPVNLSSMSPEELRNCVLIKMRGKNDIQANFSVAKLRSMKSREISSSSGLDKVGAPRGNEIISLAESFANAVIDVDGDASRRRTRNHLARVYPSSLRIDSSNYLPVKIWIAGCQMAALNLQKPGSSVLLNRALFNQNERSGYVLKPEPVLSGNIPKFPVEKLSIKILSGHRFFALPRGACKNKQFEFRLRASIHGTTDDQSSQKLEKTLTLGHDFKINAAFEFYLRLPEAAFLEISLHSTARIGTFTAVVSTLRRGMRFLHLTDLLGQKASPSSCLLAFIEKYSLLNEE